jgi:hypothetical protein
MPMEEAQPLPGSSSRKDSGLTPTEVFALATPKSPIDRGEII